MTASAAVMPAHEPSANAAPRVLLADDEPNMLNSLHDLLKGRGYALTKASCGREAIEQLSRAPFDLAILDLHMPNADGHAVMDFMNTQRARAHVIVASGAVEIDAAIGSFKRGACDFLRKPYSREVLYQTVDAALHKRRLHAEGERAAVGLESSEKAHRYLVNSSPDIIYTLDHKGRFTFVNNRAQQLLGYCREEVLGRHFFELVHEDDVERAGQVLAEARGDRRTCGGVELRLRSRHGEARTFSHELFTSASSQLDGSLSFDWNLNNPLGTYGVARDITEQKRASEKISHQAYHDPLTNLPNRSLFNDRLELALRQAHRNASSLAVLFLDLDRFKRVNDTLGHVVGDQLLQQVALRLKACLRSCDTLSRFGGDEFTVLLSELHDREDAARISHKLVECLSPPFRLAGFPLQISASVGIAVYPTDGDSAEELIGNADVAMYHVKVNGKNNHSFYSPAMEKTRLP